jgi:hypothetical protein
LWSAAPSPGQYPTSGTEPLPRDVRSQTAAAVQVRKDAAPPGLVVFEVATARRVGAQLRYNGGPQLAEIRYAAAVLTMQTRIGGAPQDAPNEP